MVMRLPRRRYRRIYLQDPADVHWGKAQVRRTVLGRHQKGVGVEEVGAGAGAWVEEVAAGLPQENRSEIHPRLCHPQVTQRSC